MNGKTQIVAGLNDVFIRWQGVLTRLDEAQIHAPLLPSDWSVKDVMAHLWTWQQVSVARMEAALQDREPHYPHWWEMFAPDPEEDTAKTNAWIYNQNRERTWSDVYADWKSQFQRYLDLTRQLPEEDLLQLGRYHWMGSYALSASAMGSLDHHEEHLENLLAWIEQHGGL